ncbi:MAG: hypothetical protein VX700_00480 [Pseudomonadota bacterium]|nr:hypothetical protein [Pseudomonadota bacterium]
MATANFWFVGVFHIYPKHPIIDIVLPTLGFAGDDFWTSLTPVFISAHVARYQWQTFKT